MNECGNPLGRNVGRGFIFSKVRPAKSGGAGNIIPHPEQKVKKKIMGKMHKV